MLGRNPLLLLPQSYGGGGGGRDSGASGGGMLSTGPLPAPSLMLRQMQQQKQREMVLVMQMQQNNIYGNNDIYGCPVNPHLPSLRLRRRLPRPRRDNTMTLCRLPNGS
jgi:hypothetical protein